MLTSLVAGLLQGSAYGLLAAGIVLVHRQTKAVNLAQAEYGSVAAFVAFSLFQNARAPDWLAVIAALGCAVLLGLLSERLVGRPLRHARPEVTTVATGAVALLLASGTLLVADAPRVLRPVGGAAIVGLWGTRIPAQRFLVLPVVAMVALALWRVSRSVLGRGAAAAWDDPLAAAVAGISARRAAQLAWGSAALLGGMAGILLAPVQGTLGPGFLTVSALVPAVAAAALASMTNIPLALGAGAAVGLLEGLLTELLGRGLGVPGAGQVAVFLIAVAAVLARRIPAASEAA